MCLHSELALGWFSGICRSARQSNAPTRRLSTFLLPGKAHSHTTSDVSAADELAILLVCQSNHKRGGVCSSKVGFKVAEGRFRATY